MTIGSETMRSRRRPLSLNAVWVFSALTLVWLLVALWPPSSADLWWQMAIGRRITETGDIPTTNIYAYTIPADKPYIYQGWLGDVLLYAVYRVGGMPLLTWLSAVLVTGSYGLLAVVAWRRSGASGPAAFLAVLAAALLGASGWSLSTQLFSLPLLAAFILVLDGFLTGAYGRRALFVPPLLMGLWVNLHDAFAAGLAVLGALTVGALLAVLRREPEHLQRRQLVPLLLSLAATLLALLASPLGLGIVDYMQQLRSSAPRLDLLRDWQHPTISGDRSGVLFYGSLLALPLLWRWRGRRPTLPHLAMLLVLAWGAMNSRQSIPWYGMALVPSLAIALRPDRRGPARDNAKFNGLVVLPLLVTVVMTLPGLRLNTGLPVVQRNVGLAPRSAERAASDAPVQAVEALRALRQQGHSEGHVFHARNFGSYLMWALPEERVFVDRRISLFDQDLWETYNAINTLCDYQALFNRYDIRRVLLDPRGQVDLVDALHNRTDWSLRYQDHTAVIFIRH